MDGELLWNTLYRLVSTMAPRSGRKRRRGHPDTYTVAEIGVCWLWSGWRNQPLTTTTRELGDPTERRALRVRGLRLPARVPHETTLRRRARRMDFTILLVSVGMALLTLLRPACGRVIVDSTLLRVPVFSGDRDATWGHHGQRGYRWHTLVSADGVILAGEVHGANVHELAVAPSLLQRAAALGLRPRQVVGDLGYDSERLHACARALLRARLIAPFNDRGGRRSMRRTPLRAWLRDRWSTPQIRRALVARTVVERVYARLKGHRFGLYALPPWVRHAPAVTRWIMLKTLLYHTHLLIQTR